MDDHGVLDQLVSVVHGVPFKERDSEKDLNRVSPTETVACWEAAACNHSLGGDLSFLLAVNVFAARGDVLAEAPIV